MFLSQIDNLLKLDIQLQNDQTKEYLFAIHPNKYSHLYKKYLF